MFTGLVEGMGEIVAACDEPGGRRFVIDRHSSCGTDPLVLGESIAVSGCCLTVVTAAGSQFEVQAGPETLARTTLSDRRPGDTVNLERALRAGDRLGGHFVQGHVDATAQLLERRSEGDWRFFRFAIDPHHTRLMVPKGSIALDGVSLTLVEVGEGGFSIMLIPHTLATTTLGRLRPGNRVNVELDILAKHIEKLLARP